MATMIAQKRWMLKHLNPQMQVELSNALRVHPIIAQLLVNRGITDPVIAKDFLTGDLTQLHDPFLLKDMDVAIDRIKQAKENNETVMVYGDYDVDGVTSSVILRNTLKRYGINVVNYIPHRFDDGYGLNHDIGPVAKEQGVTLLITIDCGINAHSEVDTLNELGIDVIIIDHHVPDEGVLPKAIAVVDPKREDCPYPFKHLASVGLAMKFSQALFGEVNEDELDLVAIGTVADVVPLIGENRIFVKYGLPKVAITKNKGLMALLDVAKIKDKPMKPHYIGFIIGPRINATGRMDSAEKSLQLLLSEDNEEVYRIAKHMESLNVKRQRLQSDIVDEALDMVERDINFNEEKVIVIGKEGWHKGVIGIVASKITETYYRPTVVISLDDGVGTASARSINGFHLHEALTYCSQILENFGGHKGAAGLTIKAENIDPFREMINEFAKDAFAGERLIPTLELDCEIPLSSISLDMIDIVNSMEPYGEGNRMPLFCSRQLTVSSKPIVLGKDTLKFWVTDGQKTISAVGFRMGKYREIVGLGSQVDLAYQISIDDWKKAPTVQLLLKDIKISE